MNNIYTLLQDVTSTQFLQFMLRPSPAIPPPFRERNAMSHLQGSSASRPEVIWNGQFGLMKLGKIAGAISLWSMTGLSKA